MNSFKVVNVVALVAIMSGCALAQTQTERLPNAYALPGTTTAVVGIAIDRKGYPKETVRAIVLHPGEKVVFAGPDTFLLAFKNKKAFGQQLRYQSKGGVVKLEVPRNILEREEFKEEYIKNKQLVFDYAITVNGKELDPPIIIRRDE